MSTYKIVITDNSNTPICEVEDFSNLQWEHVLNRQGSCSFNVPATSNNASITTIDLRRRNVKIYQNNTVEWAGFIVAVNGSIKGQDDMLTIRASGYLSLLKSKLIVSADYTATDATTIAWDLINNKQLETNGNMGITNTSLATTVNLDKSYQYKNLYDAVIELAEAAKFDLQIGTDKVFNVYYPLKGTNKSSTVLFSFDTNINSIDYTEDFVDGCNRAYVLGAGYGESMATVTVNDVTLQGQYYIMEQAVSAKTTDDTTSLTSIGQAAITKNGTASRVYSLVQIPNTYPNTTDLEVGDYVKIRVNKGRVQIYDTVRIQSIQATFEAGYKQVKYTFIY